MQESTPASNRAIATSWLCSASRAALAAEFIETALLSIARRPFKGWRSLVAKLDLTTTPVPQVPRKFRIAFTDRASRGGPTNLGLTDHSGPGGTCPAGHP